MNAILTQLDRLKDKKNVFVLATSNFASALDPAFISRVDVHFETGRPGLSAVYRILAEVVEELVRLHLVEPVSIAGYELSVQTSDTVAGDEKPEHLLLELCRLLVRNDACSGRRLRKMAIPALKEAIKMNRPTVSFVDFITLLRSEVLVTEAPAGGLPALRQGSPTLPESPA